MCVDELTLKNVMQIARSLITRNAAVQKTPRKMPRRLNADSLYILFRLCPLCSFVTILGYVATKEHKGHKVKECDAHWTLVDYTERGCPEKRHGD
jgi:hypothetical protein